MKMSRKIPLNALRVFEATARLMSFTRAGEELGMTQTAVSYQIRLLENMLGEPLFLRRPRQVALTSAGERLAPKVAEAFDIIDDALAAVGATSSEMLTIHSTATFAQQWLARHIGDFQLKHPQIAVRIETSSNVIDFAREQADVAIRWGKGDWPGLACHRIMRMNFTPMLSPKLTQLYGPLECPADLLKFPIVSAGDIWWQQWFAAAGMDGAALQRYPRNELGTQAMDAQIAIAGQGVAILNPGHFADEIAAGRLYQPFELTLSDGRDYWLAYPESRRNAPKIKGFREWITAILPDADAKADQ